VSTHYMEEAEYCHRVGLINRGQLIALDSPARLRESAPHPILEIDTPDLLGALDALGGASGVVEATMFGRKLHVTVLDRDAALHAIPGILGQRGIAVTHIEPVDPRLEDVVVGLITAGASGARSGRP